MRRLSVGILIISLNTLMIELILMRVFDVILWSHIAYMVITCAMFSFGIAGIYSVISPLPADKDVHVYLSKLAMLYAATILVMIPALNALPFSFNEIGNAPFLQGLSFLGMYLVLMVPFFFSGLMFTTLFSTYSGNIQNLYLWDLMGGAIGCVILLPLLPEIGPGGLLFLASGSTLVASALFSSRRPWVWGTLCGAMVLLVVPMVVNPSRIDFRLHDDKRNVKSDIAQGRQEFSRWDPISRIDVLDMPISKRKHIGYDGGSQSSHIFSFDGDFANLRNHLYENVNRQFWSRGVLASHYVKRDSGYSTLVIGSAGGQEIKAALMFGANRIDAVEMVGTVIEIGKNRYAGYNGGIYNQPAVHASVGEGRAYLRHSHRKHDIIQIFSNHTSSSIASGSGAMSTVYLQTVEAYKEYFSHLTDNGILHINHHVYPRMITTAAAAWKQMGRSDFRKHVVVFELADKADTLPTLLIKMSEWKKEEVDDLIRFFSVPSVEPWAGRYRIVENPFDPDGSFLSAEFYSGDLSESLVEKTDFNIEPPTDNKPFYNFLRKRIGLLSPAPERFVSVSTATYLNSSLKRTIFPRDVMHLVVTAVVSLFYAAIFIFVPLRFSEAGRSRWEGKPTVLVYFSCLGAGFIIFELVFIQIFMKLIGYPLYAYSAVIFTMLLSAGIGSYASKFIVDAKTNRWPVPFLGVILTAASILAASPYIFKVFLASPTPTRVLVSAVTIFPLGFFLGMPFPLGILKLEKKPRGAIAWAWGINGLFTVIGGLSSVILSLLLGFRITILFALMLYLGAFVLYPKLSRTAEPS